MGSQDNKSNLIRKIGQAPETLLASILYRLAPQHASG